MSDEHRSRGEAEKARMAAEKALQGVRAQRPHAEQVARRLRHERIENGLAELFRVALGGRP